MLAPAIDRILAHLNSGDLTAKNSATAGNVMPSETPDQFFGRLLDGRILLTAALAGSQPAASFLCGLFSNYSSDISNTQTSSIMDPDLEGPAMAAGVGLPCPSTQGKPLSDFANCMHCCDCCFIPQQPIHPIPEMQAPTDGNFFSSCTSIQQTSLWSGGLCLPWHTRQTCMLHRAPLPWQLMMKDAHYDGQLGGTQLQ